MVQTKRWNLQDDQLYNEKAIEEAAHMLMSGSLVAFPTETVYGLGADATSEQAVRKIFAAKGRPQDNPLIAHVATKRQLKALVTELPLYVEKLIDAFSPGPITYVLPSNGSCAQNVTAGLATVAVRIPSHPVALQLMEACDRPIAAPSANISGKPSPTTADHVWDDLSGKIAGLIDGGPTGVGMESTVLDCTKEQPLILRPGAITKEAIQQVSRMNVNSAQDIHPSKPPSPGMKYKHYTPEVSLWLVSGTPREINIIIDQEKRKGKRVGVMAQDETIKHLSADHKVSLGNNINEVATHLYDTLRSFKLSDVDLIICETFPEVGIGQAVMNRLRKAASKYI